jgi:hypothetical protein
MADSAMTATKRVQPFGQRIKDNFPARVASISSPELSRDIEAEDLSNSRFAGGVLAAMLFLGLASAFLGSILGFIAGIGDRLIRALRDPKDAAYTSIGSRASQQRH